MFDHRAVGKFNERFGESKGQRAKAGAEAADENESWAFHQFVSVLMAIAVIPFIVDR